MKSKKKMREKLIKHNYNQKKQTFHKWVRYLLYQN